MDHKNFVGTDIVNFRAHEHGGDVFVCRDVGVQVGVSVRPPITWTPSDLGAEVIVALPPVKGSP